MKRSLSIVIASLLIFTVISPSGAQAKPVVPTGAGLFFEWWFHPNHQERWQALEFHYKDFLGYKTKWHRGTVHAFDPAEGGYTYKVSKGKAKLRLTKWRKMPYNGRYIERLPSKATVKFKSKLCSSRGKRVKLTFRDRNRDGTWTGLPRRCR